MPPSIRLPHLLALVVTPADEQSRAQAADLEAKVQAMTGETVELAYVDQGYTGADSAAAAQAHGTRCRQADLCQTRLRLVAQTLTSSSATRA